ncbi:MAG: hypothetical protein EOO02_14165 [Chitinophagaceae bacterium]|nr:MAG: hypothetical protein EOO02_14165 [Chitinophagaceae bacterium]
MFDGLQRKWGVSGFRFVLIFCIFAIGGSLTGFLARRIMPWFDIDNSVAYWIVYVIVVTLIWPFCILIVSLPFAQFPFFWNYEKKLWRRITGRKSGSGTPGSGSDHTGS